MAVPPARQERTPAWPGALSPHACRRAATHATGAARASRERAAATRLHRAAEVRAARNRRNEWS
ncbi:protein of unknown function [Burkholderia multivorans]